MNWKDEEIKQYLLGLLPEDKLESLELQLFEDPTFAEYISAAETDLMEDYLRNSLSPTELKAFEKLFLASPRRVKQIKLIRLLKERAAAVRQKSHVITADDAGISESASPQSKGFFEVVKSYFDLSLRPVILFSGIIFAILLLIGVRQIILNGSALKPTTLDEELTQLNQQNFDDLSAAVSLPSENSRDKDVPVVLVKKGLKETILLRLSLPEGITGENFQIKLSQNGKHIATISKLRSYQRTGGQEIRLLLPSSLLETGIHRADFAQDGRDLLVNCSFKIN